MYTESCFTWAGPFVVVKFTVCIDKYYCRCQVLSPLLYQLKLLCLHFLFSYCLEWQKTYFFVEPNGAPQSAHPLCLGPVWLWIFWYDKPKCTTELRHLAINESPWLCCGGVIVLLFSSSPPNYPCWYIKRVLDWFYASLYWLRLAWESDAQTKRFWQWTGGRW